MRQDECSSPIRTLKRTLLRTPIYTIGEEFKIEFEVVEKYFVVPEEEVMSGVNISFRDAIMQLGLSQVETQIALDNDGERWENMEDSAQLITKRIWQYQAFGFKPDGYFSVAGITFNNEHPDGFAKPRQEIAARAASYCKINTRPPLQLEREPDNKYDPNAVAVYIGFELNSLSAEWSFAQIGYIPKDQDGFPTAETIAKLMDEGTQIKVGVDYILANPEVPGSSLGCKIGYRWRE